MKITSWSIIFVIIIFAFSFSNRMLANNKMEIIKEEVRYNNALDLSTMDATQSLMNKMINLGDSRNETFYTVLSSVNTFFNSFALTLGYYGGEEKQTTLKTYIPVVAVLSNEGFYICSLEQLQKKENGQTYTYSEHTLKPKIPYAVEDTTPLLITTIGGNQKVVTPTEGIYINYSLENMIKIYDPNTKEILEGTVVDTRHYEDITQAETTKYIKEKLADGTEVNFVCTISDDVYSKEGTYKGKTIYYEKTFYYVNNIRYLYEEWYIDDELVERRTTEYTEDAYEFTKRIEQVGKVGALEGYYELEGNYLTQGNPENAGSIDPFTGIYTIGEYNRVKNEAIANIVKEQLSSYIVLHNRYLQMNNITYTFALPNIDSEDWERAISDVSVFAFVQGIPMVGESYYNNYGIAGAQIIDREIFYGWPGTRYELFNSGIEPGDKDFPTYYSSYEFPENSQYLLEANGARIYYSAQTAAMEGYFPNIHSNDLMDELELDVSKLLVELYYRGNTTAFIQNPNNNQTGQFGATGTTTYDPVLLTYLINPGAESAIYLKQANYMYSTNINMNYSKNRILNNGTSISLGGYDSVSRVGLFPVNQNGTYIMAAREFGGTSGKSNKVTINVLESSFFYTDVTVQVGYAIRDPITERRYAKITLTGYGTPIFSAIDYVRTDGKELNTLDSLTKPTVNAVYGDNPHGYINIYDSGQYRIDTANGYGDKFDSDIVNVTIPNLPPIVSFSMNPTEKITKGATQYDSVSGLTATRYDETYLYKQGTETLTVIANIGDEDVAKGYTTIVDPYTTKWTHWYKASSATGWKNMGELNVGNSNNYSTKEFNVGTHRVYVTATDIYGASATSYIEFIVAEYIDTVNLKDWYVYDHYNNTSTFYSLGRTYSQYYYDGDAGRYFYQPYHILTGTENGQNYIWFKGYPTRPYKDFLFTKQGAEGTRRIDFDVYSKWVGTHTFYGAGFLVNTGVSGDAISGYLVYYHFNNNKRPSIITLYRVTGSANSLHNGGGSLAQVATKSLSGYDWDMNGVSIQIEVTQNNIEIRQKVKSSSRWVYNSSFTTNHTYGI